MIASLDGPVAFMIEVPIHGFELAGGLILVGQRIIDEQVQWLGAAVVMSLEVIQDKFENMDAEVQIVPGADAEEVREIAGIDAVEFLSGQLGEGLASWGHDQQVAEAFEVADLRAGEVQAQEADKGDDGHGPTYDSFHGSPRSTTAGFEPQLLYSGDPVSAAPGPWTCSWVQLVEGRRQLTEGPSRQSPVNRGKAPVAWELGRRVLLIEDSVGFILQYKRLERGSQDKDVGVRELQEAQNKVGGKIKTASFDRGFHSPENQEGFAEVVSNPCVPVRGYKQAARQEAEATEEFWRSR